MYAINYYTMSHQSKDIPLRTPRERQVMRARVDVLNAQGGQFPILPDATAQFLPDQPTEEAVTRAERKIREATKVRNPQGEVIETGMTQRQLDRVTESTGRMLTSPTDTRPRFTIRRTQ